MRIIQLDARNWATAVDFHNALKAALGSCSGHGSSPDAWVDSMIHGGMNAAEAPYIVRIVGTASCDDSIRQEIALLADVIHEAGGDDVNVRFQIVA
jgi:hypothetical protein